MLGLGAAIERTGRISKSRLAAAEATVTQPARHARTRAGCDQVEVLVTSPGRQSTNRKALERALRSGGPKQVRFVTADDEARLAYAGAVACTPTGHGAVAVCDVGGGSTEIAVGSPTAAADVVPVARPRLAQDHPPLTSAGPARGTARSTRARTAVRDALAALTPPPAVDQALASGGTARALRKLVGPTLGRDELDDALEILRRTEPRKVARRFDLPPLARRGARRRDGRPLGAPGPARRPADRRRRRPARGGRAAAPRARDRRRRVAADDATAARERARGRTGPSPRFPLVADVSSRRRSRPSDRRSTGSARTCCCRRAAASRRRATCRSPLNGFGFFAPRMPPLPGSPSETWMPVISLSPSFSKTLPGRPRPPSAESIVAEASRPSAMNRTGLFAGLA